MRKTFIPPPRRCKVSAEKSKNKKPADSAGFFLDRHITHLNKSLHVTDHRIAELRTTEQRGIVHQTLKIIGYRLGANRFFH